MEEKLRNMDLELQQKSPIDSLIKAVLKMNPWQIGAIALLIAGGSSLFVLQGEKNEPLLKEEALSKELEESGLVRRNMRESFISLNLK